MRGTRLLRRGHFTSYRRPSDADVSTVCFALEDSCNGKHGRSKARNGRGIRRREESFRESADGTGHVRGDSGWHDTQGDSNGVIDDSCRRDEGDTNEGARSSGLLLLLLGGEEGLEEAVDAEGRSRSSSAISLVRGVPHAAAAAVTIPRHRCPDCCGGQTNRVAAAAAGRSSNSSASWAVQYFTMPEHGYPPPAFSVVRNPTAPSYVTKAASPSHYEVTSRGRESFVGSTAAAATPRASQSRGMGAAAAKASGAPPAQLGVGDCRSGEICHWPATGASCSAPRSAAAAESRGASAAFAVSSVWTSTAKEASDASRMARQPLAAGGSVDAVMSVKPPTSPTALASTCAVAPASGLAVPRAAVCGSGHRSASTGVWSRQRTSVSRISNMEADDSSGSRVRMRRLRRRSSSGREERASDDDSDSWTTPVREDSIPRATPLHSHDMEVARAGGSRAKGGNNGSMFPCNGAQQRGRKGSSSLQGCWERCVANLRKTWWPRLNRGIRIGAITTLALHLSVSKSLPGIGGILGQDWCINTYSLASTVLPEQSGAVISGLWVWVFTLACIALLTFLLFPVLGFGAALGRMLCLLLFLLIVSWLSVMRLPLIYKVPPFDTDVNTHSLTSFAYLYIPYTTASVILSQQYRAFDTDLKTGLQYVMEMNTGVLLTSLLGWALFLLQVVLPPWSSQRHIVRMKLSGIMGDVAAAINDISESFVQLRHVLLSQKSQTVGAREKDQGHSLDDLRAASHALQSSCQPLYTAIGSQTQLRVSIVASSTEPYLMYPGPAVFLFPFFARCCEVLIHNCMNVITLARHIDTLARDPLPVRLDADAALANILLRTEPLLCTTMTAYQLCAELVSLRPDTLHRAAFKAKLRAGLEQLDCIDSQVSATFGLLRSPSMQEVSARQPAAADDVSVCLQRLLSRVSVGSNMGGSCPSEASAAYYPVSGVSATLERADHSLLRTWSQSGDLLPVRYNKGTERSQPISGAAVEGPLMSEGTPDRRLDGGAAVQERQPQRTRFGFPFGGAPLPQQLQQETASDAAAGHQTAEAAAPGSKRVGVLSPRRWLRHFGLTKHAAPSGAAKYTEGVVAETALPAAGGDAATRESRSAAAAAAGLEVPEMEVGHSGMYSAEEVPSLLPPGLALPGSGLSFVPSHPDAASTSTAGAAAGTAAATAVVGAPAVAAGTAAAATGTGLMETAQLTAGGDAGGAPTAGAVVTRSKGWGWDQGGGSGLKLELHPIAEEPEQHHGKPAATKALEGRDDAGAHPTATPTKRTSNAQQTLKVSSTADAIPPTAAASHDASTGRQHRGADSSVSADNSTPTAAREAPGGTPASGARAAPATGATAAGGGAASLPESAAAMACTTPAKGFTAPSSLAAARLAAAAAGEASSGFLGSEQTTSTIGAAGAATGGKGIEMFTDKGEEKDAQRISHFSLSSSPAPSSSAPLFIPLHPTDLPGVPASPPDCPSVSRADVLTSTTSVSPSSTLPLPAAATTPAASSAVTRSPVTGLSPPSLVGASQGCPRTLRSSVVLPPASTGAASSESATVVDAPLFVRVQTESASPPCAPSSPRGTAVAVASPAATGASSPGARANLLTTLNPASFGTVSSPAGTVSPVASASSSAVPSSDAVAFAAGGRAPRAARASPAAFFVAVNPAGVTAATSTSVSPLHSLASPAAAPVVTPRSASNETALERISFPLRRTLSSMDACTSDPAVAGSRTMSASTSPVAASPAVDAREAALHRRPTAAEDVPVPSRAALGGVDASPGRDRETGGGSSAAATPSGAGGAQAGNEVRAVTGTNSSLLRTSTPDVAGISVSRDEEIRGAGLRSGLLSFFSLEKSRDTSAPQRRGSPLSRLSQSRHEVQEQDLGECHRLGSHLTPDEIGFDSGGISSPRSDSLSSSTPSAESSMSSIDMDAVLTNLLQQNEGREETGLRGASAAAAPSGAVLPPAGPAPVPAAAASLHAPAVSPPAADGRVGGAGTSAAPAAAFLSAAGTSLTVAAAASTVAGHVAAAGGSPAAGVSPAVSPAAATPATPAVSAGATPAAAATAAGAASQAGGYVAAAGLGGSADGKGTKNVAAAESPVRARVSDDLRRLLSIPRRSLARIASMQRDDKEPSKTGAAAAAGAPQDKSTTEKESLAVEEDSVTTPGRKHRKDTDASITTGDRRRSTQPTGVLSPSTGAPGVAAGGSEGEVVPSSPGVQADEKVADKKASRLPFREVTRDASAAAICGGEEQEFVASEEERPVPSGRGMAARRKEEKEHSAQRRRLLKKKGDVFLRLEKKWKRMPAPWTWLTTRVPWSLVSAQSRQRQREEDLQALRALAHRSSREISGSAAYSGIGRGRKRRSPVPADFSTTAELRQELRISKLIVSLYRICAMDTQELCSTVRGLCLAVVSPSWEGARQNVKMMMLSLAMIFIQLFFGLRNLVRVDRWKWRGSEAFYRDVEAVHCMKLVFGLGVLFGCCLFYGPQIDRFLGGPLISGGPQTAKQWMILGFLCAHSFTYEGNTHKGLKRAVGTLLGGLAVELALMATSNYVLLLFLTFLSIVVVVFVFASPDEPSSEFDKEFGYIGQVFIWTVTFILNIIWIYEGLVPFPYLRDTVVRSRICGNVVGIGFSMVLTYVPPVFSAERAARTYCATLLKTCRRCILLMNAAFLSLTTAKETPERPLQVNVLESTNESTLSSSSFLGPSPSPLTAINKPFHWARMWKFRGTTPLIRKHRDWRWIHRDKAPQKDPKKAFHYYLQQAEQLLRHHSTRLLVVARMLYDEGASSEHSPVWRVDKDIGEIMNRVEYLVMSVVDAVDNLCQLAMGTDPDLAALLHGSAVLARESVLTLLQQDRRNWERVMRCRAGKALLINMVRMVKAQSVCSHLLAKEIQAAGLHAVDRMINWDWIRFPATMPPKYIRAVLRYIQGRSSIERYTNRVYESLAVCGRELREQGLFELDEWKGAIFSVLLIMEKCETRTYFMDEIHRFQLNSACRVVFANESPQLIPELFGSSSVLGSVEEAGGEKEEVRQRSGTGPSAPGKRSPVGKSRAHSYPLRGTTAGAAGVTDVSEMNGRRQKRHVSRRRSV